MDYKPSEMTAVSSPDAGIEDPVAYYGWQILQVHNIIIMDMKTCLWYCVFRCQGNPLGKSRHVMYNYTWYMWSHKALARYCLEQPHLFQGVKVTVYSLLMNYSYETVFDVGLKVYCWHKFQ